MHSSVALSPPLALGLALLTLACASGKSGTLRPDGPAGVIAVDGSAPKTVTTRYGQNYWCWNGYGNNMPKVQSLAAPLGLQLLRAGGNNNDTEKSSGTFGSDPFGEAQIDAFVAYSTSVGAEPILQVPLINNYKKHGGTPDPADAAAMVRYTNITKRHGVKYWQIGNEPDLYATNELPGYSLDQFVADFKVFAAAMKAVDPNIQIIGPDLSWKYYPRQEPQSSANDWLTPFIQRCKGSYDILAIHRYPFAANECTIAGAMGDVDAYVDMVRKIQQLIDTEAPGIPFAITEANITWDGDPTHSVYPASPQTIFGGIWVADNLAAARREGLWAQTYWSLSEGWTLGFIDSSTTPPKPKPEYHAFKLVSSYMGPTELAATSPAGFSAYASRGKAGDSTVVLVLNKSATNNAETFTFSGMTGTPAAGFAATFPAYSISVVVFPDGGGTPTIHRYSETEAAAGSAPVQVQ
jgi:hypothetical protein